MTDCDVHSEATLLFAYTPHCVSRLDIGAATLTITVRAQLDVVERMDYSTPDCALPASRLSPQVIATYLGDSVDSGEIGTIRNEFERAVRGAWDGKLELVARVGHTQPLRCLLTIEFVRPPTVPQMRIHVIKNPRIAGSRRTHSRERYPDGLPFRASCWHHPAPGEVDMRLRWNGSGAGWDSTYRRTDSAGAEHSFTQNVVAHEFGHYLGLNHTCYTPSSSEIGWCNFSDADSDYCDHTTADQMGQMMALGSKLVAANGTPWKKRLRKWHHFKCEEFFVPRLAPP